MGNHKKYAVCYDRIALCDWYYKSDAIHANIPCVILYADYRGSRAEFSVLHAGCCFCARQTEAWYADDAENDLLCMDAERDLFFQVTDQGGRRSETSICVFVIMDDKGLFKVYILRLQ